MNYPSLPLEDLVATINIMPTTIFSVATKTDIILLANILLSEKRSQEDYDGKYSLFLALLPTLR